MFTFLKNLLAGTSAFYSKPVTSGSLYLKQSLHDGGVPQRMPDKFYEELAGYAYTFSQDMALIMKQEKPVTYFVEQLDYILSVLPDAMNGQAVTVIEPIKDIFESYGLKASLPVL